MKKQFYNLSNFELKVLNAVMQIPYGQTRSYKWLAKKIGKPKSSRAVGSALNKNPYIGIIPCHRVINSDGSLGGYKKGAKSKKALLNFEKSLAGSKLLCKRLIRDIKY